MGIFDNPKGHEPFFFFPLQESVERTSAPASILPASEALKLFARRKRPGVGDRRHCTQRLLWRRDLRWIYPCILAIILKI